MNAMMSFDQSFFLPGDCKDPAYRNVRDNPNNKPYLTEAKVFVESLWSRYHDLADRTCRTNARDDFLARFWEIYLAVALRERGFQLTPAGGKGPEFFFIHNNRNVWVEAVAPRPGVTENRVPGYSNGKLEDIPEEKIILRFTGVLSGKDGKRDKYIKAVQKKIIDPDDLYILAINSRGIPSGWDGDKVPYFVKAFLPLGIPESQLDLTTGKIMETSYQPRKYVETVSGEAIPTTTGTDPAFSFVSAVLHSGVDCVNHPAILGDDFTILHWPAASPSHRLDTSLFSWCEQIFYQKGKLDRRPKHALND